MAKKPARHNKRLMRHCAITVPASAVLEVIDIESEKNKDNSGKYILPTVSCARCRELVADSFDNATLKKRRLPPGRVFYFVFG